MEGNKAQRIRYDPHAHTHESTQGKRLFKHLNDR